MTVVDGGSTQIRRDQTTGANEDHSRSSVSVSGLDMRHVGLRPRRVRDTTFSGVDEVLRDVSGTDDDP